MAAWCKPVVARPDGPKQRAQGIGPAAVGHGGWLLAARTGRGVGLILLPALLEVEGPQCAAPGLNVGFQRVAVNWLIRYDQGTGDDHLHDEPPSLVVTQPKDQVHCCLGPPPTCPSTTFWVRPSPGRGTGSPPIWAASPFTRPASGCSRSRMCARSSCRTSVSTSGKPGRWRSSARNRRSLRWRRPATGASSLI